MAHRELFARGLLFATGVFWVYLGVRYAADPGAAMGMICVTAPPRGSDGAVEVQGAYGGMQLGTGLWFLFASVDGAHTRAGLVTLVVINATAAAVRLFATLATGWDDVGAHNKSVVLYELLTASVAWLALATRADAPAAGD